jgi:hypothetical protein
LRIRSLRYHFTEKRGFAMTEIRRLAAEEARVRSMSGARLVCAYESEENFQKYHLAGAISLNVLKNLVPQMIKEEEVIFYCA